MLSSGRGPAPPRVPCGWALNLVTVLSQEEEKRHHRETRHSWEDPRACGSTAAGGAGGPPSGPSRDHGVTERSGLGVPGPTHPSRASCSSRGLRSPPASCTASLSLGSTQNPQSQPGHQPCCPRWPCTTSHLPASALSQRPGRPPSQSHPHCGEHTGRPRSLSLIQQLYLGRYSHG